MARSVLDCHVRITNSDGTPGSVVSVSGDDVCDWVALESGNAIAKEPDRLNRVKAVQHIVTNEVFPHVGLDNGLRTRLKKAHYLGLVIRKLLLVSITPSLADDRDHYANKRVDSAGVLLALIFRQRFRAFLKSLQFSITKQLQKGIHYINVVDSINPKAITAGLKYVFKKRAFTLAPF
jgi:DNA-directed RNA polymerase beta subunit